MDAPFEIRPLVAADCAEAARLRMEAAGVGFLPKLGERFYAELLAATIAAPTAFGSACVDAGGRLAGFTIATVDGRRTSREMLQRRGVRLAWAAARALLRQPGLIVSALRYGLRASNAPRSEFPAEWLTMIVAREAEGRGLGTRLTQALFDEYRRRGVTTFKSTVAAHNAASCRIHDKLGFERLCVYELGGEPTVLYLMRL